MKLSKDWHEWHDWQRVLLAWRHRFGRTGLTIHCLATICDRPPVDILDEIVDAGGVSPQYCHGIQAPILSMTMNNHYRYNQVTGRHDYTYVDHTVHDYATKSRIMEYCGHDSSLYKGDKDHPSWSLLVTQLLQDYPWPEYKSISRMKGVKSTGFQGPRLLQLTEIAKGNLIPFVELGE